MKKTRIRTNHIDVNIDAVAAGATFDIYEVKRGEKISANDAIWDIWGDSVKAVAYASSTSIYVMTAKVKRREDLLEIAARMEKNSGAVSVTPCEWNIKKIPLHVQVQLLLNGLSSFKSDALSYCNVTGKLYVSKPGWKKEKTGELFCLDIRCRKNGALQFSGTTFTKVSKINGVRAEKLASKPHYVLGGSGYTLKRALGKEAKSPECYVHAPKSRDSKPSVSAMPYFSIKTSADGSELVASKAAAVIDVIETFNRRYKGIASLQFTEINDYESLNVGNVKARDNNRIAQLLNGTTCNIVDFINTEESKDMVRSIGECIENTWGAKTESGACNADSSVVVSYENRIVKNALNIVLIHEKEYYETSTDAHKQYANVPVQHITIENESLQKSNGLRSVVDTCINNLLIKKDVISGHISVYDWLSLGYENDINIAIRVRDGEELLYLVMSIHPDGTFKFNESRLTLFNYDDSKMDELFQIADNSGHVVEAVVSFNGSDNCYIYDSGFVTMPEVEDIYNEVVANNNTAIRGESERNRLFAGNIDVKGWRDEEGFNYFTGEIGYGMKQIIQNAPHIYKIVGAGAESCVFDAERLLPLMSLTVVRNKQLTVLPFPVKYLRERAIARGYSIG